MTRPVRPSARAVLVEEDRILVNHLVHERAGDFYELPGGGVQPGETLREAVVRETREETGYSVNVHELLWVQDNIAANDLHGYLSAPDFHGVNLMFRASLKGPPVAQAREADDFQVGVDWVGVDELASIQLFPSVLVPLVRALLTDRTVIKPVYLGEGQLPSK